MSYNITLNDLDYVNKLAKYYTVKLAASGFFVEYEELVCEFNLVAVKCLRTFDPLLGNFKSYFSKAAERHVIKKKDDIIKKH